MHNERLDPPDPEECPECGAALTDEDYCPMCGQYYEEDGDAAYDRAVERELEGRYYA